MSQKSNNISHSLVEIPIGEWKNLLILYERKKTEPTGYFLLENYIRWLDKEPSFDVKCFSLDNDWQNDGTFILIACNGAKVKEVFFNTLNDNLKRLTKALLCLVASLEDIKLSSYGLRTSPAADVCLKNFSNVRRSPTYWYTVSKDVIATYSTEPPVGFTLRSLTVADIVTVNKIWPHRFEGSEEFVRPLIEHNDSVAACDDKGNLVAWCLRLPTGALGLLQVVDTHKRLGLGSLMVRCMAKKITELGQPVLSPVVTTNTPSMTMFEGLGFKRIDQAIWSWTSTF